MSRGCSERGFTLLEVLVALAILALVMVVLGQTLGGAIRAYGHLDMKTRAWLVASDKMVEMQVYARWPEVGTQTDRVQQDGEDWQVTTQVTQGPFDGTRRVDIAVTLQEDAGKGGALYTLSGLLGKPAADETGKKQAGADTGTDTHTDTGADTNTDNGAGTTDASTDSAAAASSAASDWEHP